MRRSRTSRWIAAIPMLLSGALAAASATSSQEQATAPPAPAFPTQTWAQATPESQGIDAGGLSAALEYLGRALSDFGGIGTVFIVRNGYAIWAGPESDKECQIYSATKSFTSTALGLLVQMARCRSTPSPKTWSQPWPNTTRPSPCATSLR